MKRALTLLPIGLSLGALVLAGCGSNDQSVSLDNTWARTSAAGQTTGAIYFDLTVDQNDTLLSASVAASIAADAQVHEVVMAEMDDSDAVEGSDSMDDMADDMADMTCEEIIAEHNENSAEHMDDMDSEEMTDMDDMDDIADMTCEEIIAEHNEMSDEHMDDMADMDSEEMAGMGAMTMQELTDGLALTAGETVSFEPGSYHVMLLDLVEPLEAGDEVEVTLEFAESGSITTTVEVAESAP